MATAHIAQKGPFPVELEAGQTYYWCRCGNSKTQPFCDGSHKAEGVFSPVAFTAEKTGAAYLCGCKQTHHQPNCDGTHKSL